MPEHPPCTSITEDAIKEHSHPTEPRHPYLFVVLDCDRPLSGGARLNLAGVDLVTLGRGQQREVTRRGDEPSRALDLRLPGGVISSLHARIVRVGEGFVVEDGPSRNGTVVNGELVERALLRDGDLIEIGPVFLRYRSALPGASSAYFADSASLTPPASGFAALLPQREKKLAALYSIARLPITVLLLGETGTGKEVLARAIHAVSGSPGPFVAVNCGGLTGSLLESQLFGHVKGAFTGAARDEIGYIRSAEGGTLFLDEVGDLPLSAQSALLRVLQEREVVPVGGTRPIKVDLRVVAATHRPLDKLVVRGEFRADLLGRLSGYRYELEPLRDRMEELGMILDGLLRRPDVPAEGAMRFSKAAARKMLSHPWPLNIRELQQCLSVAAALCDGEVLEPAPESHAGTLLPGASVAASERPGAHELRQHIIALLKRHNGKVSYVARDMGKARMQIHRWMRRFGIDPKSYRG